MTTATVIRLAAPDEAEYLSMLAVRSKAHWGYSDEFINACRPELTYDAHQMESNRFEFMVAERLEVVVGFYASKCIDESTFELEALFVDPEFIGEGVGRLLIEHAVDNAAIRGGESLIIQGDPNAERFYLAAGAKRIGSKASGSIPGRMLPLFQISLRHSETDTA